MEMENEELRLDSERITELARHLHNGGSDPNFILIHPAMMARIHLLMERHKHWYWRLWYRAADVARLPARGWNWWRWRWHDWRHA